jgi:hypothetical protein
MSRFSFWPGDGSSEIYLEPEEKVRSKDNVLGVAIWRRIVRDEFNGWDQEWVLVKDEDEILVGLEAE